MGLDDRGLLVRERLLLCLAELLDEAHGLALQTALEPAAGAGVYELQGEWVRLGLGRFWALSYLNELGQSQQTTSVGRAY